MEDSDDDSLIMAGMPSEESDAAMSDEEDYFEFNGDLSSDIAPNVDDMDELCKCPIIKFVNYLNI